MFKFSVAKLVFAGSLLFSLMISTGAHALDQSDPEKTIAQLTKDVLVQIERYRKKEIDIEGFVSIVEKRLDKSIDFEFIMRGVMGAARKKSTDEQRTRFLRVFKDGMINSYAKSFMDYDENSVKQLPMDGAMKGRKRVQIKQVLDDGSVVLKVSYTLANTKNGWMIINVNVNGINLGARYRSQFTKAYKKSNSVDAVIDEWETERLRF